MAERKERTRSDMCIINSRLATKSRKHRFLKRRTLKRQARRFLIALVSVSTGQQPTGLCHPHQQRTTMIIIKF